MYDYIYAKAKNNLNNWKNRNDIEKDNKKENKNEINEELEVIM